MKGRHLRSRFPWLRLFVLMLLAPLFSFSQESIKVVDENMLPLIGAYVKFLDQEDITDENGIVVIEDNYNDTTALSFRYISYNDLELTLGHIRNNKNFVQMFPSEAMLEQVVIVGRTDQNEFDIPYMVSTVRSKEISSEMVQTAADALSIKGGAYIQKSQMGGGSPVLRGFEANRILLVVDGVRLNNAIYRNGHLQSSITIDPDILQQAEIIYGPGSLMYGSDALGGVVHFRTKAPLLNLNSIKSSKQRLSSYVRYNSANNEKSFHAHHMYSARKFGVLSSITVRDFGDLKMGSKRNDDYPEFGLRSQYVERIDGQDMVLDNEDPNLQIGTGYKQYDFLQKWIFRLTNHVNLELNAQYSTSSDIPRYDNLIEQTDNGFRYAEWYYGPQDRLLISPKLTWNTNKVIFDKMIAIASFQNVTENRVFRFFDSTSRENQDDRVKVYGMTVDFQKRLTHNQDLEYGVDVHYNDVSSSAFSENISNPGQTESTLTRYPSGGSSLTNIGAYMQFSWKNQDSTLNWINGFRWTKQDVMMDYREDDPVQWPDYFYDGINVSDNSVVGITGVNYKKNGFCGRIVTGTAFRAANVDDLAKIRINSNEITVPNPELESERVWNSEIGLAYEGSNFRVGFTSYYSLISDAMVRSAYELPDGSSFYVTNGDSLNVTANINAQSGVVKGINAVAELNLNPRLKLFASYNIQSGKAEDEEGQEMPLGHIPPSYGLVRMSYESKNMRLGLNWQYNGWKHIEDFGGSVDNPDLATADGSPSWSILNINGHFNIHKGLGISLAANNLFDLHYRPFSSGVSGPGRHFIISLKYDMDY